MIEIIESLIYIYIYIYECKHVNLATSLRHIRHNIFLSHDNATQSTHGDRLNVAAPSVRSLRFLVLPVQAMGLDDIKTHHWCIIGCSAVTGENLLSGVDWLLDDIGARVFTAD